MVASDIVMSDIAPPRPADRTAAADRSARLVAALRRQLGADGTPVTLIETHISWVLLAGEQAWKIKRPVNLGFLDFSSLALRRFFCEEELRLNRRHAPQLYLGVLPVSGTPEAPEPGGDGVPIEYLLQMRRFPPRALLSERLADGRLQATDIEALARRVAKQHEASPRAAVDSGWGSAERIAGDARAVLQRLQQQGAAVDDLQSWLETTVARLAPQWSGRLADGWVRECHGDLHLRNAVVLDAAADDGVVAFDGLEFDPALRWIDVQSDLAFMTMDLMAHRRDDLAMRWLDAWLTATGDVAGMALQRFYAIYRALVRAMVGRLHPEVAPEPGADDYLALARRLALRPETPRLLVTHGLSGSGKSWLTLRLLERCGALRLRSDVERKRLHGLAAQERSVGRVPGGIYGAEASERTYAALQQRARSLLAAGWPVIVDAACLRRTEREAFRALAAELAVPFTLLDCQAAPATLQQRVRQRQGLGQDPSEADLAVLARQIEFDEPLAADELATAIVCSTDDPALDLAALTARWGAAAR